MVVVTVDVGVVVIEVAIDGDGVAHVPGQIAFCFVFLF